ncbi:MAG: NAD(P)H-quinone oxidoreductase [Pseudomonadota bacterium]
MTSLPDTMHTVEIAEPGPPHVLSIGERPVPAVPAGHVLVKNTAAGVNGPDIIQRKGFYPPPPGASDIMGLEVSGQVVALGDQASRFTLGDRVCALTNGGGYAHYTAIDENHCLPIPPGVAEVDAAGLCETYFTVWSNFFFNQALPENGLLLVHGGAGGIGSTAIQLGKAFGLRVFATSGKEAGLAFCRDMGADRAIHYKEEDFVEIVKKEGGGADIILDIIGGDYVDRNLKCANPDGRIVQLAFNHGSRVEANLMPVMLKRLTLTGSTLRPRPPTYKAAVARDLEEKVWPLFADGTLKVHTHKTFSMEEVRQAHELMESAQHQGKILLTF